MFNFIFDGKIGEFLAPVKGTGNQLNLAIQHQKNSEVENIIGDLPPENLSTLNESGIAPIHVSCRFNNKFALNLIATRGVSLELKDFYGNTPLHYAAKYGNLEICKYLISKGCVASVVNNSNQTPYDVSDNHVVRQYLLPLQFQQSSVSSNTYNASPLIQQSSSYSTQTSSYSNNTNTYVNSQGSFSNTDTQLSSSLPNSTGNMLPNPINTLPNPTNTLPNPINITYSSSPVKTASIIQKVQDTPIVPFQQQHNDAIYQQANMQSLSHSNTHMKDEKVSVHVTFPSVQDTASSSQQPQQQTLYQATSAFQQPPITYNSNNSNNNNTNNITNNNNNINNNTNTNTNTSPTLLAPPELKSSASSSSFNSNNSNSTNRIIRPDGFHSSSSDPELQKKYGHVKEAISIAPPPIMTTGGGPMTYSLYSQQNNNYNSQQQAGSRYVSYNFGANSPNSHLYPSPSSNMSQPSPLLPLQQQQSSYTAGNMQTPVYNTQPPIIIPNNSLPPLPYMSNTNTVGINNTANNNPVSSIYHQQQSPSGTVYPNHQNDMTILNYNSNSTTQVPRMNIFNPATDCDVVSLDANSKALI